MKIARIEDEVKGNCSGSYQYTKCSKDSCWTTTSSESGYITAKISQGSSNVFCNGKAVARVGDNVDIHKNYSHSGHFDSIDITGHIIDGSLTIFCNGKSIAWEKSKVKASDCSEVNISQGSNNVFINK